MLTRRMMMVGMALSPLAPCEGANESGKLVEEAVAAAGGAANLPRVFRWRETWFLGDSDKPNPREALLSPPNAWFENGKNIATGNPDRAEKTYLVWVWTLAPLLDPQSQLMLLPDAELFGKVIRGVRLIRKDQKPIDVYFDKTTKKLARMDWRTFQIDFADWREVDGFRFPAKAFVRKKDGSLHLRTEFQVLEKLKELPAGLVP